MQHTSAHLDRIHVMAIYSVLDVVRLQFPEKVIPQWPDGCTPVLATICTLYRYLNLHLQTSDFCILCYFVLPVGAYSKAVRTNFTTKKVIE
jgi:hypothetical protein